VNAFLFLLLLAGMSVSFVSGYHYGRQREREGRR
jgi:hypothetical protein